MSFYFSNLKRIGLTTILFTTLIAGCASSQKAANQSVDKEKKRASLYVSAAVGAIHEGDPISALQFLTEAEKLEPNFPEIHHNRALAYFLKKELKLAIESAKKAVELLPDYSDANNTLGKLLLDSGHYQEAEAPLVKAASDPMYRSVFKAHTNLGILYYRQSKFKQAEKALEDAISSSPESSCVAQYYRGHLYLREKEVKKATNAYKKATHHLCANFADAHYALGIAFERNKQFELARKKFLEIQEHFPETKVSEKAMKRLRYLQ